MTWGMVISKEIDESKMDYRGSKSELAQKQLQLSVKEQRADASSYILGCVLIIYVRCALVTTKVALKRNMSNLRLKISQ